MEIILPDDGQGAINFFWKNSLSGMDVVKKEVVIVIFSLDLPNVNLVN